VATRPDSQLRILQVYRGLAAGALVFDHLHFHGKLRQGIDLVPEICRFGHLGVDFFFVLSGFIIQHIHGDDHGRPERGADYLWRRIARIWPLLVALTTLKLVYMLVSGEGVRAEKFELGTIVASYLCLPQPGWPLLDVAWTLQHEALFYGLFLVPILFGQTFWRVVMAGWLLLILVVLVRGTPPSFPVSFLASALNAEFLMGVAAAVAAGRWQPSPGRAGALLVFGGSIAIAGFWSYATRGAELANWSRLLLAAGLAVVIHASVALERAGKVGSPSVLVELGDASYSLYLWHGFVVGGAMAAWPALPAALQAWPRLWLVVVGIAAFASSVLVYHYVERPLTRWFRNLMPRQSRA
jgi:peptidoglycan/LPS O-acetylase OafA/YrhL